MLKTVACLLYLLFKSFDFFKGEMSLMIFATVTEKKKKKKREPPEVFYKTNCLLKFRNIPRKTPTFRPATLLRRGSSTGVFL